MANTKFLPIGAIFEIRDRRFCLWIWLWNKLFNFKLYLTFSGYLESIKALVQDTPVYFLGSIPGHEAPICLAILDDIVGSSGVQVCRCLLSPVIIFMTGANTSGRSTGMLGRGTCSDWVFSKALLIWATLNNICLVYISTLFIFCQHTLLAKQ